jgi:hypothetical protein
VIGADGTYVKVKGEKVGVQVVVDDQSGDLLGYSLRIWWIIPIVSGMTPIGTR